MADSKHTIAAGAQDFDETVLQADTPVVVDFWAAWCGPCRVLAPMLEGFAADYEGRVKVVKVNVDENPELAQRFGVRGIPTLIAFEGGKDVGELVGVDPGGMREMFADLAA